MYYSQRLFWPYLSIMMLVSCFPNLANAATLDGFQDLSSMLDSSETAESLSHTIPQSATQPAIEATASTLQVSSGELVLATANDIANVSDKTINPTIEDISFADEIEPTAVDESNNIVEEHLEVTSAESTSTSFSEGIPTDAIPKTRVLPPDIEHPIPESDIESALSSDNKTVDDITLANSSSQISTISIGTTATIDLSTPENSISNTLPDGAVPKSVVISAPSPKFSETDGAVLRGNISPIQVAQIPSSAPSLNEPPSQDIQRIPQEPIPDPEFLPPLEDILDPGIVAPPSDDSETPSIEESVEIQRYEVIGSTVFSVEEFEKVTSPFTTPVKNRPITFSEVLEARAAVTQLYLDNDYITSGAIIPTQEIVDGVAIIQVIEGRLEDIEITGTRRLNPGYIRSRLALGAAPPLDVEKLLEKIQLLQLDPLIENISVDLQAGTGDGTNLLVVEVTEADSFDVNYTLDNNRSPSVGTVRHQLQVNERNLFGLGDNLRAGYTLTSGSNSLNADYTLPLSPHNTTLNLAVNLTDSDVREDPFDVLDISSESDSYQVTLRHPLIEKPQQEFALGLTASHQRSQTSLGIDDIGPFPLSPGADDQGRTKVSALRFFQEWTQRNNNQVVALRSQFNVGLDALDSTVNSEGPDSRFFSWQGQGQWVRRVGSENLLLVRGGVQLATDSLLTLEQFGLGGQSTVRGFRQDQLLTDNGALASVEFRLPIVRDRDNDPLLQLTPFLDAGIGWNNNGDNPDNNTLVGIGTGLLLDTGDLTARLDWGIPLTDTSSDRDSLQENGIYFSLSYSFF